MNDPTAMALAAGLAAAGEAILLNPLTLLRNRRFAGLRGRTQWGYALRRGWARGLPLQLATLTLKRAWSYGVVGLLDQVGAHAVLAGMVAGATEGFAFAPSRRIYFLQQTTQSGGLGGGSDRSTWAIGRLIVAREGWRGLWRGAWVNTVRAGIGGAVFFGTLAGGWAVCPTCHPLVIGATATLVGTVVMNPAEVWLARLYRPKSRHDPPKGRPARHQWKVWARGMNLSLLRAVPGAAVYYWLVLLLKRAIQG